MSRPRPANDRSPIHGIIFEQIMNLLRPHWPVALTQYNTRGIAGEIEAGGKRYAILMTEIREPRNAR